MHSSIQTTIFGAGYSALFLAAACGRKTCHPPSVPRMAHGQHHAQLLVAHHATHDVARGVARKSLPECSLWAAGARPIRIPARAAALLLRKAATGLRALGLKPASLLRKAQASLPVPRSHRAPAGQGQNQNLRAGRGRKLACERSAKAFPKTPSSAPAPDWRPIPSLRSVMSRPPVGRASRWTEAPHRSRLGALPPLALVGTRACFCRDRLSQRWGASFPLLRLGASHHGSPALGAWRKLPLLGAKVFAVAPSLGRLRAPLPWGTRKSACLALRAWAAGARPIKIRTSTKCRSIRLQTDLQHTTKPNSKPDQTLNKE